MLSIENPPSDPPCPCQISQLKSSDSDEIDRASHKVDLPNPNPNPQQQIPLSNFSIRDYVFAARSKDIKKNWPFSLRNLQLCLKHGVKDVLPPFQALDSVRNKSIERCTSETSSPEKQNISNVDAEPCGPNDLELLRLADNAQLNHKLPDTCTDTKSSCRSGGENDFPSTTTSVSQSEIESVHNNRPSSRSPPIETDTLLEPSVEVEAAVSRLSHKTENTSRPPGKKCRLIVKFGGNSDRSSTAEDIASNCTTASESMASKVCPVCRTFSSPSNTTLNAHIDQCLSMESTPKWTADSKLTRHRIKPRRTRLMIDIYADAKRCTLEELDRRNGTSWASIASMFPQETGKAETPAEAIKQRVSQVHPEDSGDVGPVYIDANGTKLRILSKFNDEPPVSKVGVDLGPRKPLKGSKRSKFFSAKKKKRHALRKHHKYLKLAAQSKKKFYSSKTHVSQISGPQERHLGEGEGIEDHQVPKPTKSSDTGTLQQWVCSKRSGPARKIVIQDGRQSCKWHVNRDLLDDSDQSCLGDSLVGRNRIQKFANLSENMLSSPQSSKRMGKPSYDARLSEKRDGSSGRRRVGVSLVETGITDDMERSLPPMKRTFIQLSKDSPPVHSSCMLRSSSSSRIGASSPSDKVVHTGSVNNFDVPSRISRKPFLSHATASKTLKFSSSRKNVLSITDGLPGIEPRYDVVGKCSALRNTDSRVFTETDEEVEACHSEGTENQYGMEEITDEMSLDCGNEQAFMKEKRTVDSSIRKETRAFKHLQPTFQSYSLDEEENTESSAGASDYALDKVDGAGTFEGSVVSWRKSVDTKLHKLTIHSKTSSNSLQSIEDYGGPFCGGEALTAPAEPSLVDGEDIFCHGEVGNGVIGQDNRMGVELDAEAGEGNCFPEVDPIPIPGPPGSFLPSPRDMGSDDFPGNSSLTTSRVHSSQDQHELVDGDSSSSPISATSSISNPTATRSDLKFSEPLSSVGPQAVQDKVRSGFGPLVENAATVPQTTIAGAVRTTDGENFKLSKISFEKRPLSFRNDDQPCCCQRKERVPQGVVLDYQESQLLKRRAMASTMMPPMGKQLDCSPNTRSSNLDIRPGKFPLNSSANLEPEKAVLPVLKSSASSVPLKGSTDAGVKFSARADCDSSSPSASNPILRLMGKNLMVVNKEDDASVPLGQTQSCAQVNHLTSQFPTLSRISLSNLQNQDGNSYYHMVPQGSVDLAHSVGRCFDASLANNYQGNTNLQVPQTPSQVPAAIFLDQHMDGSFTDSMEPHKYEGDCIFSSRQNRSKNRLNPPSVYDQQHKTADSENASGKEIIVIDDISDNEATGTGRFSEGLMEGQLPAPGISAPTVGSYNVRPSNAFPHFRSQDPSICGESPVAPNTSYHATAFRRVNSSPVRWNCTPEGFVLLQQSSFVAAPSSTGHLGSTLYYSSSFP